jgi:predicted alpha/beta-fold hydrolase
MPGIKQLTAHSIAHQCREEVRAADGTTLLLDWAERSDMSPSAPILILLSGVTGSGCVSLFSPPPSAARMAGGRTLTMTFGCSRSSYITYLAREGMQKGWRCVTLNYPGTLGEQLTVPRPMMTIVLLLSATECSYADMRAICACPCGTGSTNVQCVI